MSSVKKIVEFRRKNTAEHSERIQVEKERSERVAKIVKAMRK